MFRQTPAFGSTSSTFGSTFGSTGTNNPTGFGQNFGRPTTFGTVTTASTTPFGSSATGGSLFGQQTQAAGGSLFGSSTSSGFGTMSTFGSSGGSMFNTASNPTSSNSLFGSTSAFNTSQNQQRGFSFNTPTTSSNTSGGLFGTTTTPAGGSMFGSTMNQTQGTTIKYAPIQGTDTLSKGGSTQTIQTKIEVISAMQEYQGKSLEELRVEDYLAGRKGGTQAATGFGFGSTNKFGTQQSTPLFGQTSAPSGGLFGAKSQGSSLFGTNTNTGFGTSTSGGSLFSSGTSTFGQPATSSTGFSFGSSTQAKPTGFSFQSSAPATGFGASNTTSQAGTGFGSSGFSFGNTANTGGFGAAKPIFGATNTATSTGGFGAKPAGFGSFGTSTASPFGATTGQTGGLFGSQTQNKPAFSLGSTSGFGTTTGFGTSGGSLFNQNAQNKTGGLSFGTGSSFGTPASSSSFGGFNNTSTGLFGSTNTGGGLFGNTNTNLNTGGLNFGSTSTMGMQNQNTMGGPGTSNINNLIKALTHNPFGNSSLLKSSVAPTGKAEELLNPTPSPGTGPDHEKAATKKPNYVLPLGINKAAHPKPIGLHRRSNGHDMAKNMLFVGLDESTDNNNDTSKVKFYPNVKKLGLKVFKNKGDNSILNDSSTGSPLTTPLASPNVIKPHENLDSPADFQPTDIIKGRHNIKQLNLARNPSLNDTIMDLNVASKSKMTIENKENSLLLLDNSIDEHPEALNDSLTPFHPAGIKLTRKGYYTLPSLDDLKDMIDEQGRCLVENFTVGRYNYGNVCFLGTTDVAGLNLDSIIFIVRKEIEVYPENTEKPSVGEGLNKPAYVTLDCVWPIDKKNRDVIKCPERLEEIGWSSYLEKQCVKMDASFVEYRHETGSWVFKVRHFSKYGLQDDDEEEPAKMPEAKKIETVLVQSTKEPLEPIFPAKKSSGPPSMPLSPPTHRKPVEPSAFSSFKKVLLDTHNDSDPISDCRFPQDDLTKDIESRFVCPMSPSAERMAVSTMASQKSIQNKKSQLFFDDDEYLPPKSKGEKRVADSPKLDITFGKKSAKKLMISSSVAQEETIMDESTLRSQLVYQPEFTKSVTSFNDSTLLRGPRTEYSLLPSLDDTATQIARYKPKFLVEKIPMNKSSQMNVQKPIADAAAMMGRSFRIGWGPGLTFVHGGPSLGRNIETPSTETQESQLLFGNVPSVPMATRKLQSTEKYIVKIEKLSLTTPTPNAKPDLNNLVHVCMKTVLNNLSEMADQSEDEFPYFEPNSGLNLLHSLSVSVSQQSSSETSKKLSHIFNLCVALWGDLDFYSPESDGKSLYVESQARKEALSQWLTYVAEDDVQSEVEKALCNSDQDAYLDAIFSHLTARHISEACYLAQKQGDYRLSLLIAQACCSQDVPRIMMKEQLSVWLESGADKFISDQRMSLFTLLAGMPTHDSSKTKINTCLGLDWKRCLALHLWYICPATVTIAEALEMFDEACGLKPGIEEYCEKPRPPYMDATLEDIKDNFDICYHLLKVYVDCTHKLDHALENSTSTPDPMDVTTSWLVWSVLYSLGFHSLSKGKSANLHIAMATLLESLGHWEWAAFVLLFISDYQCREKEMSGLLLRHLLVDGEPSENDEYNEKEEFLLAELGIPRRWIYRTKAIRAKSLKMIDEEAFYRLKGSDLNKAHEIIIDHIAPHAIVNEDHTYLRAYLQDTYENQSKIASWVIGGGIYWAYLEMVDQIDSLKASGDLSGKEVEKLRPKLLSLCSKLNNLKCPTSVHKVAVSEMSRVVVSVLRAVLGSGPDEARVLALQIASLPLTQECALEELNIITHQYLTSLSKKR